MCTHIPIRRKMDIHETLDPVYMYGIDVGQGQVKVNIHAQVYNDETNRLEYN